MAFQQYNSAALKERTRKQLEYEEYLAKKMSEEEDKRQKKYGFSLYNLKDHLQEDYDPKTSLGNRDQYEKRTGSIYKDESPNSNDGKMSPALHNVLHPPVIGDRIDSKTILSKPKPLRSNSRTAKKWHRDRQNYTRKKGKKGKKTRDPPPAAGGGRKRRRKQRGGNTPECLTTEYSYAQLENRIGETFHVKVPEIDFMNDGNYRLEDYGIDGEGGEGDGIGLRGVSGGANGDFHVDATDITNHRVRICKLDDGSEKNPQAGGRRKKRRKTRKKKRSKKGGYDSCVGKTPTPEEYCANILDIPVSNAECDDNTGLCLEMEETSPLDFSPHTPDYDPDETERMLPDDDFSLEDTTSGGSRKKRKKTRKNKRSKKRRGKKRKTRKKRRKRR